MISGSVAAIVGALRRSVFAVLLVLSLLSPAPALAVADDSGASESSPQSAVAATIDVNSDVRSDAGIARRLRQLFAALDGLGDIEVEVSAGVVALSGEVTARADHEQALDIARRVQGVVDVQDRIAVSQDVRRRLLPTMERLLAQLGSLVAFLPLLGVALIVLAAFWWLARRVSASEQLARRFGRNPFLRDLVRQLVRMAIIGLGVVLALEILDATALLGTVLGAAGVVGLAVGFALRDTVENYIASLLLSLRQPFAHNDLVVIDGNEGRVLRLTARATILMTVDGNHTRLPNAMVYKAVIVNYTRNPKRRFAFDVGVDTDQNLVQAQTLAAGTLAGMDGVLDDPAPSCTVETLGDSNVLLRVFGWVDQSQTEFIKVRSEAIRLVKRSFDQAGIVMPEPIYNVILGQASPLIAGAPPATTSMATPGHAVPGPDDEPCMALDIARQDHLDRQIAADRSTASEDDLLDTRSPKE
ncbi:mechanosensitive ion channel family protein [Accumulibacter sp.]|uniref:mechanosensitive ion channel family protein n=1 Tax=Accumulibacter sp. TaxID=2053492 RepID=UPI0028C3DC6F|nr:mechanosensitive ion channel family protein [Accumulibacter sp.]